MDLVVIPWAGGHVDGAELKTRLERDGCDVFRWSDPPAADYAPHSHDHDESIWLLDGEITFSTRAGDLRLGPGDRLMLPRGTVHGARAGRSGATYLIGEYPNR